MEQLTNIEERTVALAGIFQACKLVQDLARDGTADSSAEQVSLKSIMVMDAINTPAVYGGIHGVKYGLETIKNSIDTGMDQMKAEVFRYVISLTHLQKQLYKDQKLFGTFANKVESLSRYQGDELQESCSEIYKEIISPLRPQIIVQGEKGHLSTDGMAERVRSLLLAGIRSTVLWKQNNGSYLSLMFRRGKYKQVAENLLRI